MALYEIPSGIIPQINVETLPKKGEPNTIYNLAVEGEEFCEQYIWHDGEYIEYNCYATINSAIFNIFQQSVKQTVAEMQAVIDEQAQKITELEAVVNPVHLTSWEMSLTSLIDVTLDLYNENDEEVELGAMMVSMCEAEPTTFMAEVKEGTYYLKNSDGYALGKPNGDLQPLVANGSDVIQLGSVEIVQISPKEGSVK